MGTNFYFKTTDKELAHKFDYELCEHPYLCYSVHLAKTSAGWLPLFQLHSGVIESVDDLKKVYFENKDKLKIFDEYDEEYSWSLFEERVIKFNGGYPGAVKREYIEQDKNSDLYDPNFNGFIPISHFEYGNGAYKNLYKKDSVGYEFMEGWFS